MDGAMSKGYFDQLPQPFRESMMDNAKAFLKQAENPMPMDFNIQELKRISSVPTLFVKGECSPALALIGLLVIKELKVRR